MMKKRSLEDIIVDFVVYVTVIFMVVTCLYPFLNIAAISLNDATDTVRGGIHIWPRIFSLDSYKVVFRNEMLVNATLVSIARTALGTLLQVFFTTMLAYGISRKEYVLRHFISFTFIITMYISGGLIPTYMLYRHLGLTNSFWVYIIPGFINIFSMIVVRTYITQLPESFVESAHIDGAGHFRIFISIILPLCTPVLAVIALFAAVDHWNQWWDVFLYNSSNRNLSTLQYELVKILESSRGAIDPNEAGRREGALWVTPRSIQAAMTMVATMPVILVYPFLQRYFVKGMTLGGVKG